VTRHIPPLLALAALLAGCGNPVHSHYSVDRTAPCLEKLNYDVDTDATSMGPIEASATDGALRAREKGNAVVITFSDDAAEAANIERAYRRFAPKKLRPHISDVMLSQKNAVLRWTITPPKPELDRVLGCLR
jgi:hypothetical protein